MTTPSQPHSGPAARRGDAGEPAKTSGARTALAGGVLAVIGILLMVLGGASLAGVGVVIAVIALLPTLYGAYRFSVGAKSGGRTP